MRNSYSHGQLMEGSNMAVHQDSFLLPNGPVLDPRVRRVGKWLSEEEAYVTCLIDCYSSGLYQLPEGESLRYFLSKKLNCDPMRITKKFPGTLKVMKTASRNCHTMSTPSPQEIEEAAAKLLKLEKAYLARLARVDEQTRLKRKRLVSQILLDQEETCPGAHSGWLKEYQPQRWVDSHGLKPQEANCTPQSMAYAPTVQAAPLASKTFSFMNINTPLYPTPSETSFCLPQQPQPNNVFAPVALGHLNYGNSTAQNQYGEAMRAPAASVGDFLTALCQFASTNASPVANNNNQEFSQVLLKQILQQKQPQNSSMATSFTNAATLPPTYDSKVQAEAAALLCAAIFQSLQPR